MSIVKKTLEVVKECIIENNFKELETDKIEIKDLSTNSDWNELYKIVCAFLNTNGGNIIIGINENKKNKKYKLTGFNYNNENKLKEIIKQFFDQKGTQLNLSNYFPDYEIIDFMDNKIAILYVEKLPEDEKFVFYNGIAYKRKFTGDHEITQIELKTQEERKLELIYSQEIKVIENATLELLNIDKLNEYIHQLNIGKKVENIKANLDNALPFLIRKGFIKDNKPTLLGLLVCGDYVEDYIQGKCEVDCYVENKTKIAEDKQVFKENIIDLIKNSVNYIYRNTKVSIISENGGTSLPEYPEELVREVVNNALAHRDYKSNRFIIIEIRPNESLMIQNPGNFLEKQKLTFKDENCEIRRIIPFEYARNPKLTDLLKSFNRWEGKGKGLASITDACLKNLIDLPYYILKLEEIKLYIPKGKIYDDRMESWLNSFSGYLQKKIGRDLNLEEKIILSYFYKSELLNNLDRYTVLLTSDNNHKDIVAFLESKGLIIKFYDELNVYPIYLVDRTLTKIDYFDKLELKYKDKFNYLQYNYKKVLNAIYHFENFGNPKQIISANNIGNYLYFQENTSIIDSKKFENYKRSIRLIFNKLEKNNFIIKNKNRPNYSLIDNASKDLFNN